MNSPFPATYLIVVLVFLLSLQYKSFQFWKTWKVYMVNSLHCQPMANVSWEISIKIHKSLRILQSYEVKKPIKGKMIKGKIFTI